MDQRSEEWFKARLGKVTASCAWKLLSDRKDTFNKFVYEKAAEIMTQSHKETPTTVDMQRGILLEEDVRLMLEMKYDQEVQEVGFIEHSKYAGCSPDGLVGKDGGIEIKAPLPHVHLKYITEDLAGIDMNYIYQIQFCLFCTKRKWWDFVSYNEDFPDNKFYILTMQPDQNIQEKIKERLTEFIERVETITGKPKKEENKQVDLEDLI